MRRRFTFNRQQLDLLGRAMRPGGSGARHALFNAIQRRIEAAIRPPRLPPQPPLMTAADARVVAALQARGAIPSVCALIVVEDDGRAAEADLERALAAALAQRLPFETIVLHAPTASRLRARIETLAATHPAVRAAWSQAGTPAPKDGAILIQSASVALRPEACAVMAATLRAQGAQFVYADAVFVDETGAAGEPFRKPSYSPRLAEHSHYMGRCGLIETPSPVADLADDIARATRSGAGVAATLTRLAATLAPGRVARAPHVLYEDAGTPQMAVPAPLPAPRRSESVAIVIPTRDKLSLLQPCIASILERTDYPPEAFEIIVVDNGSKDGETLRYLGEGEAAGRFRVIRDDRPFNYARLNNEAARATSADVLLFLNNDTLVIQPDWLTRMVDAAMDERVGAVGVKLLYEDGTVQHGGVVLGFQGVAAHADVNIAADAPGYHGLALHDREVSAVTGACMAVRRSTFRQIGGFDEALAVAFNDTLLCTRMLEAGLVNLQLNSVRLTHLESKSRGFDEAPEKKARFLRETLHARKAANAFFLEDAYYNPGLSLQEVYAPAAVPRHRKPWRAPVFEPVPRVLILGAPQAPGDCVAVAMAGHAALLRSRGFEVHAGGPAAAPDFDLPGCVRATLGDPVAAIAYAAANDIDVVLAHTAPFFAVSRWAGAVPIVAAVLHGAAGEDDAETRFALACAQAVYDTGSEAGDAAPEAFIDGLLALWRAS